MVILGISVGTRASGIAIVSSRGLLSWNTLSFKDSWSQVKCDRIVRRYERYRRLHNATVIVLKVPRISHHTEAVISLLREVNERFLASGCMVEYRTQADIRAAVPEIRNRNDMINYVASRYPILDPERASELASKNSYHGRMFEAVMTAHLLQKEKL